VRTLRLHIAGWLAVARVVRPLQLACPSCHSPLTVVDADRQRCPACDLTYRRDAGIWRLLTPGREDSFRQFVAHYETVRVAEGRCVQDPDRLRALPFRDMSRRRPYEWSMRARSFESLLRHVISPLERERSGQLRILDLGSGLGWLAYRLALRGHLVAAVDLVTNDFDGLGAHCRYDCAFDSLLAEFDHLPLPGGDLDLAIYNSAFHYAADYVVTLREALRVLGPDGRVVIMDSPLYRDASSGAAMVREREDLFERQYGFRSDDIDAEGFLTYDRLATIARTLGIEWELFEPWYGVRWWLKPHVARLRGSREPARFKLIVGRRLCET
jgi:SAM-dependent methyltransferase